MTAVLLFCGIVWANPIAHTVSRVCLPASMVVVRGHGRLLGNQLLADWA